MDQIFLGLLAFLTVGVAQVGYELSDLKGNAAAELELWEVRSEADASLSNVRKHYADIVRDKKLLPQMYFEQKIGELDRALSDAALRGLIQVHQDADTTTMMLSGFEGETQDVVRAVHFLADNEFLFDVHASHFFSSVAELVSTSRIKGVQRLFVLDRDDELEEARTKRLLQFHRTMKGFDFRIIRRADYVRVMRDFGLSADTRDFGVYARRFVYKSQANTHDDIRGVFLSDPQEVQRFIDFFDRCWTHRVAFQVEGLTERISHQDLFGDSVISPNRPGLEPKLIGTAPPEAT